MIKIEQLEDECDNFLQNHFDKYYKEIDPHVEFIEEYKLVETKKNMLYAYDFLDDLYQQLRSQHVQFASETCNKLHATIKQLHKTLDSFEIESRKYKQLFTNTFVNDASILIYYRFQMEKIKKQISQPELIRGLQANYNDLLVLYRSLFYDMYLQFRQDIRSTLKWILNVYLLYFDTILWQDALKSPVLKRYFESLSLKKFDTKHYILRQLTTTSKVTIRYTYLYNALKAY